MAIPKDYLLKLYGGWYGKIIGIRHGSNVEGWTYEKIKDTYGEVEKYLFSFKNFAADDDSNGPIFFIRALEDHTCTEEITPKQMGETLLNYVPCGQGFFWWGGYGVSTEHTAYENLEKGIDAPLSGSAALNGSAVAEQIGGQIFIDTWGLVNPGDPERAARYAAKMASVTHDGNGVFGGMFVAACVSAAFTERDIQHIIRAGLSVIPADCEYRRMADAVDAFYRSHPENWRDCFAYVKANWGYDRYPGNCHIIPNAAVMMLSMLYGAGDFSRTVNICNMCGWDTDCNVGNVGCILGVLNGIEGIRKDWIAPINDFLACSSVLGCMNLRDIANDALYLASLGYRAAGEKIPERLGALLTGPKFAFALPESTHTFRAEGAEVPFESIPCPGTFGGRCLRAAVPDAGKPVKLYRQTYYRPCDFDDNRYSPSFTPEVFPGQTVLMRLKAEKKTKARLFASDLYGREIYGEWTGTADWTLLRLALPPSGACIGRVGVETEGSNTFYIDYLTWEGNADYTLDFAKAGIEKWTWNHREVGQTSHSKGIWECREGKIYGSGSDHAEIFTGGRDFSDYSVTFRFCPETGRRHLICVRTQGMLRGYLAGFLDDALVILKNGRKMTELAKMKFAWDNGREYEMTVRARGSRITLCAEGACLSARDEEAPFLTGCFGFSVRQGSRCRLISAVCRPEEGESAAET